MATRYSGNATVRVKWSAARRGYEASVSVAGKQVWHEIVVCREHETGSPEAYDEVARSALTFLDAQAEEGRFDPSVVRPAYDQSGRVEVARTKEQISVGQHKDDHGDDERRSSRGD